MSVSILISSVNYSGKTADITFSASTGGTTYLGSHILPYLLDVGDHYYGEYFLYFPEYNQTCSFLIPDIEILNAIITEEPGVYIEPGSNEYLIYVDPPI